MQHQINSTDLKMEKKPQIIITKNSSEFSRKGADIFLSCAKEEVQKKGYFTVALSGGATPATMYKLLAGDKYRYEAPWTYTHIFWVDERCVPVSDPASNYGRALEDFIHAVPIPPIQIHNMPVDLPPEQGVLIYEQKLINFFQLKPGEAPAIDLIFLGVGADGHTASLFPGSKAIEEKNRLILSVKGGDPDVNRITMTLPVINNARKIIFLVTGKNKAMIVRDSLIQGKRKLPVQKIKPVEGKVVWLLDKFAASLLTEESLNVILNNQI
jgi:6-phosphogluconolactonase